MKKKWYEYLKLSLFSDMLKENGKWSQGRVYLLISVIAYYTTLTILTLSGVKGEAKGTTIDLKTFDNIINALQWSMGLFAGYAFGGKGIDAIKSIFGSKNLPTVGGDTPS